MKDFSTEFTVELCGLPITIEARVYFGSTTGGGPDPSSVEDIVGTLNGIEIDWDCLLALYAAEHDMEGSDAHNKAEDALIDTAFEHAQDEAAEAEYEARGGYY